LVAVALVVIAFGSVALGGFALIAPAVCIVVAAVIAVCDAATDTAFRVWIELFTTKLETAWVNCSLDVGRIGKKEYYVGRGVNFFCSN